MLKVTDLVVCVDKKQILSRLSIDVAPGTIHAIMGPNGSGKTTLAYAIAGHPSYAVTAGCIEANGQDITQMAPEQRARNGVMLVYQQPPTIPGVRVSTFLYEAYRVLRTKVLRAQEEGDVSQRFAHDLETAMATLSIDRSFLERPLNDGFSGGERKRFEMLQVLLFRPSVLVVDEIDSGLDVDAVASVAGALRQVCAENSKMSVLLITHYQRILHHIKPDKVSVLCDGNVVASGDHTLAQKLEQRGYHEYRHAQP